MSCLSQFTKKNEIFTAFRAVKFARLKNIKHFKDHKITGNFQTLHKGDVKAEEQHIRWKIVRKSKNKGYSAAGSSPCKSTGGAAREGAGGSLDGSKTPHFHAIKNK